MHILHQSDALVKWDGDIFAIFAVYVCDGDFCVNPVLELVLIGHEIVATPPVEFCVFRFLDFLVQFDELVFRFVELVLHQLLESILVRQHIAAVKEVSLFDKFAEAAKGNCLRFRQVMQRKGCHGENFLVGIQEQAGLYLLLTRDCQNICKSLLYGLVIHFFKVR